MISGKDNVLFLFSWIYSSFAVQRRHENKKLKQQDIRQKPCLSKSQKHQIDKSFWAAHCSTSTAHEDLTDRSDRHWSTSTTILWWRLGWPWPLAKAASKSDRKESYGKAHVYPTESYNAHLEYSKWGKRIIYELCMWLGGLHSCILNFCKGHSRKAEMSLWIG
jgi:hypothetical protein